MVERPTCIGCGEHAPNTDTNYTLISATFGWRLTRRVMPDGTRGVEWRCPKCWNAHKNVGSSPVGATRKIARIAVPGAAAPGATDEAPTGIRQTGSRASVARGSEPPPSPSRR